MSIKRFSAKRDANEPDIIQALREHGCDVIPLDVFDLLVLRRGKTFMLECKAPKGRPTDAQALLSLRGWPLHYVRTPEEALKVVGAMK